MATLLPPPSKKVKLLDEEEKQKKEFQARVPDELRDARIRIQFIDQATGQPAGDTILIPLVHANVQNLESLLNQLTQTENDDSAASIPYRFSILNRESESLEVEKDLYQSVIRPRLKTVEDVISLQFTPETVFRVRAVTRCSSSVSGHGSAILATQFSPSSSARLVTGSGDCNARIWDCETGTPFKTLKGHSGWILAVSYSPDGRLIATGSYDNTVRIWDSGSGALMSGPLKSHTKWITSLAWEPLHSVKTGQQCRLASASKDSTVRIWNVVLGKTELHLASHKTTVSCVKWGGTGRIFTSSHDKTVKVWDADSGQLLHTLTAHAHWVNHLALSTDHVIRTGGFSPHSSVQQALARSQTLESQKSAALTRFQRAAQSNGKITERLVTASDDFTIYLWDCTDLSKPIARLLGHHKQVNHVTFSPDGHYIASCGFDNHIKLWQAVDGKFLKTLRGHVAPVYQCCFSADSRLLVSASKDTTLKAWDVKSGALVEDLPGHKDEVFAVDWSPDGARVASGGKDKLVRIWSH